MIVLLLSAEEEADPKTATLADPLTIKNDGAGAEVEIDTTAVNDTAAPPRPEMKSTRRR